MPDNQLLVRCVGDRLVMQPSGLTNASLRVRLLETPAPNLPTTWERSNLPNSVSLRGGGQAVCLMLTMRQKPHPLLNTGLPDTMDN